MGVNWAGLDLHHHFASVPTTACFWRDNRPLSARETTARSWWLFSSHSGVCALMSSRARYAGTKSPALRSSGDHWPRDGHRYAGNYRRDWSNCCRRIEERSASYKAFCDGHRMEPCQCCLCGRLLGWSFVCRSYSQCSWLANNGVVPRAFEWGHMCVAAAFSRWLDRKAQTKSIDISCFERGHIMIP